MNSSDCEIDYTFCHVRDSGSCQWPLVLGLIVSTFLLTVFYYLVVTPIGLAARLFGKDFLERKFSRAPSYWLVRTASGPKQPAEYEQQF